MQINDITKLLDLKGLYVTKFEKSSNGEANIFYVKTKLKYGICPDCGKKTSHVHDKRVQKVKDIPIHGKPTYLMVSKRRFNCNCGSRFIENIPFVPKHYQMTSRLSAAIINDLRQVNTIKSIARQYYVSTNTVQRLQKLIYISDKPSLPETLSIDEFKGNSDGIKYHCILVDPKSGKLIDILKDRKEEFLVQYFKRYTIEERRKVKYFVCDMWKPYVNIAKNFFPEATILIDKYHYVRQVIWALDGARKRIQKNLPYKYKKHFFNCRKILMKRYKQLDNNAILRLENMFWYNQELRQAYELKEQFFQCLDIECPQDRAEALNTWISLSSKSGVREFEYYAKTFVRWKSEIINSFYSSYTNGCTEGINNLIKVIKRVSFGYRNFNNFRTKIMHVKG